MFIYVLISSTHVLKKFLNIHVFLKISKLFFTQMENNNIVYEKYI